MDQQALKRRAHDVLRLNSHGSWTTPAPGYYPHQWLWDSCFIALGLARVDPALAAHELVGLTRGQWSNGMMPHMIYSRGWPQRLEARLWARSQLAPLRHRTSDITQPPVLAIAVERVAASLPGRERGPFLALMLPVVVRFHEWLYRERDPEGTGLVALIHSWESGMDDSPPWGYALRELPRVDPQWKFIHNMTNRDERATDVDAQRMMGLVQVINRAEADNDVLYRTSPVLVRDVSFNSILAAAGESLARVADEVGYDLPEKLVENHARTRRALETLWDEESKQYYSFDVRMNRLIDIPTVATFMPLYAGSASPERAEELRRLLVDPTAFGSIHPIPSVPLGDPAFQRRRYWSGPSWINMNWFVIRGLERYDFYEEAEWLRLRTLGVVDTNGFREYYDPISGEGLGAHDFAWTAALVLDLLG